MAFAEFVVTIFQALIRHWLKITKKTRGSGFPSLFISRGCKWMVTGNCLKTSWVTADEDQGSLGYLLYIGDDILPSYMDVSENSGFSPQIIPILRGFSMVFHFINHPFWGTPIFGNTHIGIIYHDQDFL